MDVPFPNTHTQNNAGKQSLGKIQSLCLIWQNSITTPDDATLTILINLNGETRIAGTRSDWYLHPLDSIHLLATLCFVELRMCNCLEWMRINIDTDAEHLAFSHQQQLAN